MAGAGACVRRRRGHRGRCCLTGVSRQPWRDRGRRHRSRSGRSPAWPAASRRAKRRLVAECPAHVIGLEVERLGGLLDVFARLRVLPEHFGADALDCRSAEAELGIHPHGRALIVMGRPGGGDVAAPGHPHAPGHQPALRRFVCIELKSGKFEPEFVSKMNFYLNAVDEQLRLGDDRESVGIILCAYRDETVAKLALRRVYAPIAVSTWRADTPRPELPAVEITEDVPADLSELSELDAA